MNNDNKNWDNFVNTGLLTFINSFLQIFGWMVYVVKDEDGKVKQVYPKRTNNRTLNQDEVVNAHIKLRRFLNDNNKSLNKDISELEKDKNDDRYSKSRISLEDIFRR